MHFNSWIIAFGILASGAVATFPVTHTYDVAIIGGGASGSYAAARLHDQGKSIALIERNDYLGGHTETYIDPSTKTPIDIGVVIFKETTIVRNFFDRFHIPLTTADLSVPGTTNYIDFRTGKPVLGAVPTSTPAEQAAAFEKYKAQLSKHPYLTSGYHLPNPIPPDLLIPFGLFVEKYNLAALIPIISLFTEGFGDLLNVPSLYILSYIDAELLNYIFANKFLTTAAHDNNLLYSAVQNLLGHSVFLNTHVSSVSRNATDPAILQLSGPSGTTLIRAKRILVAFPQLLSNFAGWDLDSREHSIFSRFNATGWYTGLLRHSGILNNLTLQNAASEPGFHLPVLPGVYNFYPSPVPGLLNVKYGTIAAQPLSEIKSAILATLDKLRAAGAIPKGGKTELPVLRSHTPYELRVSVSDIRAGFYDRLYQLQGYRDTFYTGAAFQRHQSALIWAYTDGLLENITRGL